MISPIALITARLGPDWVDSYVPADDAHLLRHTPSGLWCALDDEMLNALHRIPLVKLVEALRDQVEAGVTGEILVAIEEKFNTFLPPEMRFRVIVIPGRSP